MSIPSVTGFSASPSVVGLHFLFTIMRELLSLVRCWCSPVRAGYGSVPAAVEDGLLRFFEAENSVLPTLRKKLCPDHPPRSHVDSEIVK